jgi:hypothetical protein
MTLLDDPGDPTDTRNILRGVEDDTPGEVTDHVPCDVIDNFPNDDTGNAISNVIDYFPNDIPGDVTDATPDDVRSR